MSYGRRKIFTDAAEITAENVVREVNAAYLVHLDNRNEIIELCIVEPVVVLHIVKNLAVVYNLDSGILR